MNTTTNSVMTKNLINILYPDSNSFAFAMETNGHVDHHDILERVFAEWNHGSGMECELFIKSNVRSLSVNDIVCVNGTFYQCESFGWAEVTAEYVNQLEKEVATHPRRFIDNPWIILSDIMWKRNKNRLVTAE